MLESIFFVVFRCAARCCWLKGGSYNLLDVFVVQNPPTLPETNTCSMHLLVDPFESKCLFSGANCSFEGAYILGLPITVAFFVRDWWKRGSLPLDNMTPKPTREERYINIYSTLDKVGR